MQCKAHNQLSKHNLNVKLNELQDVLLMVVIICLIHQLIEVTDKCSLEDREMQEANVCIDTHVNFVTCDPRKLSKQRAATCFQITTGKVK